MQFSRKGLFITLLLSLIFISPGHSKGKKYRKAPPRPVEQQQTPVETEGRPEEEKKTSPLEADLELTSNYMFRGITQNNNNPAIQGGLTYTVPKVGIYGYVWGSPANFKDANDVTATTEVDFAIGVANTIKKFRYDLSFVEYNYPHSIGLTYNEFIASTQWYFITALLGYSGDVYASGEPGTYYNLGVKYDIPPQYIFNLNKMNISGGAGHYSMPQSAGLLSYDDYGVQLAKTIKNYQFALAWTDTNGKSGEEPNQKNSKLIFTISALFS